MRLGTFIFDEYTVRLEQGDVLSSLLSNLEFDYLVRKVEKN